MNLNTLALLLAQPPAIPTDITGMCIDSRTIQPGNVFIAIKGERFDGHAFIKKAVSKGAIAVIASYTTAGITVPQFIVADPLEALSNLAQAHRKTMTSPVIALTGSNGKTTVKEMIASIFPFPSHATKGNLNNHIGVPLSVVQMRREHRYAVFELGANHLGEIAKTVAIVQPNVALINNVAPAHIEGFGSIAGVAQAKGEIYQGLAAEGTAIINADDAYAHFWDSVVAHKKVLRFSAVHPADVYAHNIKFDSQACGQFSLVLPNSQATIKLSVPGLHNIYNALAAAACCYAVGISTCEIQQGLAAFKGVLGRMTVLSGKQGATIIDDTYNANLRSVLSGLEVLAQRPGKKIFVFGDMGELGVWANQHHSEVGLFARKLNINSMFTCGSYSVLASEAFGKGALHFSNQESLIDSLVRELTADTTVLVKGSRSSAMEKIVYKLLN